MNWLLLCTLIFCRAIATVTASTVASGRPAASVFCVFDCSAGPRPSWPGRCLQPTQVYSTQSSGWLTLATRFETGIPIPELLPDWKELTKGDVTWEGWFRVLSAPVNGSNSLISTYGANHDSQYYAADGVPATRRRYGGVMIDKSGRLSVQTNTGYSTGNLSGPNIVDARWHHIAAIWRRDSGGGQIKMNFKVWHADLLRIEERDVLYSDLQTIITDTIAEFARVPVYGIRLIFWDDSIRVIGGYTRFGVNCTINPSMTSDISDHMLRLASRNAVTEQLSVNIRNRIMQLVNNAYPVKPFNTGPIRVDFLTFPEHIEVGSVELYVDRMKQPGKITYAPGDEHLAQDGQLVIGGGQLGRPLNAEVQHFRLWSRALTLQDLVTVSKCGMPGPATLFGGPFPHDLYADFVLDGSYSNSVNPMQYLQTLTGGYGDFIRGGLCGYPYCPEASEHGCPLVKNRQLNFNSTDACQSFARFNFCRRAGQERGRPPYPYFDGCHSGGGNEIAEITL